MPRLVWVALALISLKLAGPTSTQAAEKRVALVVGNSAYQHTSKLNNTATHSSPPKRMRPCCSETRTTQVRSRG